MARISVRGDMLAKLSDGGQRIDVSRSLERA